MSTSPLSPPPAVYGLLREPPNLAVEAAILAGLPDLSPTEQEAALDTLVDRGRDQRLVELLSLFESWGPKLQERILARADRLYAAARLGVADEVLETRLAVIEFTRRAGDCKLAYLLADGLRHLDPKTRERAARALTELTAGHLTRYPTGTGPTAVVGESRTDGDYLAQALARAVRTWELHFRPEVLTAAMWMGDRIEEVFFEEVAEPRSKLARAVREVLTATDDGRLAGFALRALLCPALRSEVARMIEASSHPAFARGLMAESWLLSDRSIGRAWRRVHRLAWLDEGTVPVAELGPGESEAVVRLIAGSGMPNRDKVDVLVRLLDDTGPATRRAVFWALVDNRDEAATGVLQGIACRRDDPLAAAAARDVRRRRPGDRPIVSDSIDAHARRSGDRPWDFEAIWQGLDEWDEAACEAARQGIEGAQGDLTVPLRVKMASLDAGDRLKALRLIRMWRLTPALAERIYRLCNDGDAMVRSLAVGMLADLEGPTARRILRRAVDDPDARVQANAIEAFEAVHLPDREGPLTEKLRSPHHRVRATAVAALLRMQLPEAGETLLDMLESPQQPQRISALWVIERLNLVSLMHRLIAMADHDPDVQVRRRAARVLETIPAWTGLEANDRSPVTVEGAP